MILDQRYCPRVSLFLDGELFKDPDGVRISRVVIRDLSSSGMRIEALDGLDLDETVYVDFSVAGRFDFKRIPARVTRIYPSASCNLVGLTFLNGHNKRKIHQALNFVLQDND